MAASASPEPVLGKSLTLGLGLLTLLVLALTFARATRAPVAPSESYIHWSYGRWIVENQTVPRREPLAITGDSPRPILDPYWLAQVLAHLAESRGGLEGIALWHAFLETFKASLLILAVRRTTGSWATALFTVAVVEILAGPLFGLIQIRTPAEVCFAALLLVLSGPIPGRMAPLLAPLLAALWANLHGSFPVAFLLMAGLLLGRFLEQLRGNRSITRAFRDPGLRRLAIALGASIPATLLTPYGKDLFLWALRPQTHVLTGPSLWPDLFPAQTGEGRAFLALGVLLLATLRLCPRPWPLGSWLLILVFLPAAWWDRRFLVWWLMLGPCLLAPSWNPSVQRFLAWLQGFPKIVSAVSLGAGIATLLAVLVSSPVAGLLGRAGVTEERLGNAPHRLAELLREQSPGSRRILPVPLPWSDFLVWSVPAAGEVYWHGQLEAIPERSRQDIALLLADPSSPEARTIWERSRVDTVVVGRESAPLLQAFLRGKGKAEGWKILEETSGEGMIAVRQPAPAP